MALSRKVRNSLIAGCAGVCLASGLIGMIVGRYDSPDYSSEAATQRFLVANVLVNRLDKYDAAATLDAPLGQTLTALVAAL